MIGIFAAFALLVQEPDRWSEATVGPIFADGRLRGCALNFKAAQRDNLYFGGRAVGTDGSFNLYHFGEGQAGAMLKVAVLDGEAMRLPDTGYLITGFATNAEDITSNMVGDDAGYRLTTFSLGVSTAEAIGSIAGSGAIIVGVQMSGGKSAIPFRADLTQKQGADWANCVDTLVADIESALGPIEEGR